jgi:hypothetical protein
MWPHYPAAVRQWIARHGELRADYLSERTGICRDVSKLPVNVIARRNKSACEKCGCLSGGRYLLRVPLLHFGRGAGSDKHSLEHVKGLHAQLTLRSRIGVNVDGLAGRHHLRFAVDIKQHTVVAWRAD